MLKRKLLNHSRMPYGMNGAGPVPSWPCTAMVQGWCRAGTCRVVSYILIISILILLLALTGCGGGGGSSSSSDDDGGGSGNTITLLWDAPTKNVDGSPLTDLAGYKVYYGTESGGYDNNEDVGCASCDCIAEDNTECTYIVENLTTGRYYFAVTAYDTANNESDYSNEVSKDIE